MSTAAMENAGDHDPSQREPGTDQLLNLLVERQRRAAALPTKYVAYVDMLGFGALVRAHPGAFNVDIDEHVRRLNVHRNLQNALAGSMLSLTGWRWT
jgi:hypothetical protein